MANSLAFRFGQFDDAYDAFAAARVLVGAAEASPAPDALVEVTTDSHAGLRRYAGHPDWLGAVLEDGERAPVGAGLLDRLAARPVREISLSGRTEEWEQAADWLAANVGEDGAVLMLDCAWPESRSGLDGISLHLNEPGWAEGWRGGHELYWHTGWCDDVDVDALAARYAALIGAVPDKPVAGW